MPLAAPRPCKSSGCPAYAVKGGYCGEHQDKVSKFKREADYRRGTAASRGYGSKWRKAREDFLRGNPLCAECSRKGRATPATIVDHIEPHRGDMTKFWSRSNWQPLCKKCHDKKTATENGGFGN